MHARYGAEMHTALLTAQYTAGSAEKARRSNSTLGLEKVGTYDIVAWGPDLKHLDITILQGSKLHILLSWQCFRLCRYGRLSPENTSASIEFLHAVQLLWPDKHGPWPSAGVYYKPTLRRCLYQQILDVIAQSYSKRWVLVPTSPK